MCIYLRCCLLCFFFFKQKTAYEMRISDWSSDVCSSDLEFLELLEVGFDSMLHDAEDVAHLLGPVLVVVGDLEVDVRPVLARRSERDGEIGRASCRDRVCQYV